MVATQVSWWPDAIFFRSTDSGATWTRMWDFTSYPNRSFRYTMDISSAPWLTFGTNPQPPEVTPKLGWMNESVEIDPFNSDRLLYGTGATLYGTTNLTNWDTGTQFTIKPMVTGLEETAVQDLISPPTGAPLISGLGDIGGFRHTNLDAVPASMFTGPVFTSTTSLDYAETNASVLVRAGNFTDSDRPNDSHVAFSTDGGANWFQGTEPGGVNTGGTVAAAADGSRFVWAPGDAGQQVVYSVGFGNTWTASTGVPSGAVVESDRVNPKKFYAVANGTFYVSTNGGAAFTAAATGLPATGVKFKAVPGHEGDIWLAGGTGGMYHSTNGGASFTKVANVTEAYNIGFGKAAPGQTYQALYTVALIDGVNGVFRSDDAGASWVRINDDQHQYGNIGEALTGDPRIYGRVYIGTNGRGIIYGDRISTTTPSVSPSSASPSRSASPSVSPSRSSGSPSVSPSRSSGSPSVSPSRSSASPSVSPSRSVSPSPSPSGTTGGCKVAYSVTGQWPGGFQGAVHITNTGATAINGWTLTWSFANGQVINQMWGGTPTQSGANVSVASVSYTAALAAGGGSQDVGFLASMTSTNAVPTSFKLNGTTCAIG